MSTLKSTLVHLVVASALCVTVVALLASESGAAVPEKASSQQEEIGSASFSAAPSTVLTLQ
jgi:hypothetical protein